MTERVSKDSLETSQDALYQTYCFPLLVSSGKKAICDPDLCIHAKSELVINGNRELNQLGQGDPLHGWRLMQESGSKQERTIRYAVSGEKFPQCKPKEDGAPAPVRQPLIYNTGKAIGNVHKNPYAK